ncbi:hypothetical protein MTO96_000397 [Rhipicephalus appendiculatus]
MKRSTFGEKGRGLLRDLAEKEKGSCYDLGRSAVPLTGETAAHETRYTTRVSRRSFPSAFFQFRNTSTVVLDECRCGSAGSRRHRPSRRGPRFILQAAPSRGLVLVTA